ncbi:hypothetical protein HOC96_05085 [archaeon]|jgi:hypothetical protein|nr:hypothetical protein [archaeon]
MSQISKKEFDHSLVRLQEAFHISDHWFEIKEESGRAKTKSRSPDDFMEYKIPTTSIVPDSKQYVVRTEVKRISDIEVDLYARNIDWKQVSQDVRAIIKYLEIILKDRPNTLISALLENMNSLVSLENKRFEEKIWRLNDLFKVNDETTMVVAGSLLHILNEKS